MGQDVINRKLTTIFAADVVGYSRLMSVDEEATLRTLRAYREVIDSLIAKHGGRIFNTAGDAVLAEFGSAVEAVRCAISIQEDLRVRNSEFPEDRQMWLRIGVNVGDVMVEGNDLFGDGVNVAARLEGLAQKGGICLSGSTFEQVKNKLSVAFSDLGSQKVKNIPEPIAAYALIPGDIAIKNTKTGTGESRSVSTAAPKSKRFKILAGMSLLVVFAAALFWRFMPDDAISSNPFDGHWRATVKGLSGCKNNTARTFAISVKRGQINEPQHPLPKTGSVAKDGRFVIKASNRAGNLMATLTGTLKGKAGNGRIQGLRPTCTGVVTLERLE